jgi:NitT/TauT family transport system permease protein
MKGLRDRLPPLLLGLIALAGWEGAVRAFSVPHYVLPGPALIAEVLWRDTGLLFASLWVTLRITAAALVVSALAGAGLALAMAQSRALERALLPYAVIAQVTPVVAVAPLIIIWVNDAFAAMVLCALIVAFFPVLANTMAGLKSADRNLAALFRLYGATRWQAMRYLRIPTAMPYFLAGLRISGGLSLVGAVVAEFVAGTGGTQTGLAYRILESGYRLQIPRLFAALVLLSLTGIVIYAALNALSNRVLRHWHESASEDAP